MLRMATRDAVNVNGSGRNQSYGGPEVGMPDGCLEVPRSSRYPLDNGFLMDAQQSGRYQDYHIET